LTPAVAYALSPLRGGALAYGLHMGAPDSASAQYGSLAHNTDFSTSYAKYSTAEDFSHFKNTYTIMKWDI
jgi:hypothetical protein